MVTHKSNFGKNCKSVVKATVINLIAVAILSGCARISEMLKTDTNELFQQTASELQGKSVQEILDCAGLPNTTVDMEDKNQVLVYVRKTTRYASCRWSTYGRRCSGDYTFNYYLDDFDIIEYGCRVGFWIKDGKVNEMSFEAASATSIMARDYCVKIVRACLSPNKAGGKTLIPPLSSLSPLSLMPNQPKDKNS